MNTESEAGMKYQSCQVKDKYTNKPSVRSVNEIFWDNKQKCINIDLSFRLSLSAHILRQ